jgi:hypothetical protein
MLGSSARQSTKALSDPQFMGLLRAVLVGGLDRFGASPDGVRRVAQVAVVFPLLGRLVAV